MARPAFTRDSWRCFASNCPRSQAGLAHGCAGSNGICSASTQLIAERRVRPTVLQPLWNVAGFMLGAATALISEKAALACTDAIETEIDRHYGRSSKNLATTIRSCAADIADFRADELEHRDSAREAGATTHRVIPY